MRRFRVLFTEGFRLTALLTGLFVTSSLALMVAMYIVTDNALTANSLKSVESDFGAMDNAFRSGGQAEVVEIIGQLTAPTAPSRYYLLQDPRGQKLAGNLPAMTPLFEATWIEPPAGVQNRREHKILGEGRSLADGNYLFVGADGYELSEAKEHIFDVFAAITGIAILLTLAVGALLSGGALRRIDSIIDVCRAVAANQWNRRIALTGGSREAELLATTINGMLDRISDLMESLRQVSSDIAHDLRTPLTHMRQRLEQAQRSGATSEEHVAALERALTDTDEILAIFTALLNLSHIEAGMQTARVGPVNLSALLTDLAQLYAPVADDRGQKLLASVAPDVMVAGDKALLTQMFSNLIENALHHSPEGTAVHVALDIAGGEAVARVSDTGPGVAPADREMIFNRFWRAERSRSTPGHGLGLALVAAIAKVHRVTIDLTDNQPGLVVGLRFAQTKPEAAPT